MRPGKHMTRSRPIAGFPLRGEASGGLGRRALLKSCGAGWFALAVGGCGRTAGAASRDLSLAMVGDIIYLRPALGVLEADAGPMLERLRSADVAFGNFESSAFDLDVLTGNREPVPGGPVVLASSEAVAEVADMGFDLLSAANNHMVDWREEGAAQTLLTLRRQGFAVAGDGLDLRSARGPASVSTDRGRVGLVAATASFADGGMAQDADAASGRPAKAGVSGLRVRTEGDGPSGQSVNEEDEKGILDAIAAARADNDVVIFSFHTHHIAEPVGDVPPAFVVKLAHDAIDRGADVVAMHGPHQLRGIEIYKGKTIFYSLGNFAIMLPSPELNPEPMVLPPGSIFTRRAFFESVVATLHFSKGRVSRIELLPIELRETDELGTHCLPRPVQGEKADAIIERLDALSKPLGVTIINRNGLGIIDLSA